MSAVENAKHLNEIGFAEFTSHLINEVFDALVSSNIRQMEAYSEVVKATSEDLKTYINDTQDNISPEMIADFLEMALPNRDLNLTTDNITLSDSADNDEVSKLNSALAVSAEAGVSQDNKVAKKTMKTKDLLDAVATRVAANKYDLLKEMVKQGILRLVVENGQIETRLTFSTYDTSSTLKNESSYRRTTYRNRSRIGTGILSLIVNHQSRSRSTNLTVSTASKRELDRSGSHINIFGGVKLNFKTDYLALNEE